MTNEQMTNAILTLLVKRHLPGIPIWLLAAAGGCAPSIDEAQLFIRQATPVVFSAPEAVRLSLWRAGADLDGRTAAVGPIEGEQWLEPGRWIVQADDGTRPWYYPVTLRSFRSGPDRDGAWIVSVRPRPMESPPQVLGMSFAWIPSGWFVIGDRRNALEPHPVWLSSFYVAIDEVSNAAFRRFLSSPEGWMSDSVWTSDGLAWRRHSASRSSAMLKPGNPDFRRFGRDELPVTNVTWFEANAFARWVTRTFGEGQWEFALPHEAEWEKAARGPDDLEYVLSQHISDRELEWFNWKKNPSASETVLPVTDRSGRSRPNGYGIRHMAGNVTEWTRSVFAPFSGRRPFVADRRHYDESAGQRVARGGSWYSASVALLSASYRDHFLPGHSTPDLGFRLRAIRIPGPGR